MVCFNYRRVPAVALAKQLIDEGRIGRIFHIRAVYLQDWIIDPDFPMVWRFKKELAGSGAHGDLNAHIIDLARYLVGDFDVRGKSGLEFWKEFLRGRHQVTYNEGITRKREFDKVWLELYQKLCELPEVSEEKEGNLTPEIIALKPLLIIREKKKRKAS